MGQGNSLPGQMNLLPIDYSQKKRYVKQSAEEKAAKRKKRKILRERTKSKNSLSTAKLFKKISKSKVKNMVKREVLATQNYTTNVGEMNTILDQFDTSLTLGEKRKKRQRKAISKNTSLIPAQVFEMYQINEEMQSFFLINKNVIGREELQEIMEIKFNQEKMIDKNSNIVKLFQSTQALQIFQ